MSKTALLLAGIGILLAEPLGAALTQMGKDQKRVERLGIPVAGILTAKPINWCACQKGNVAEFDNTLGIVAYEQIPKSNNRTAILLKCFGIIYDSQGQRATNICEDWVPVTR